jgi:hypothetical protein
MEMTTKALTTTTTQQLRDLHTEFEAAKLALHAAEAELAEEAAAVNAFRMHCRLRLDELVDSVLTLYAIKQELIAHWRLAQPEPTAEPFLPHDDAHPLGSEAHEAGESDSQTADQLVPYQLPHDKAAEKQLYRELVKKFHPDLAEGAMTKAYATTMMVAINSAYEAGDAQRLYDLAGELDSAELAALGRIEVREVRQLRERVMKCTRRQRKVRQQLAALRQEKIAKLWRKAQALGEGENWWEEMAQELAQTQARLAAEVEEWRVRVDGL